MNIKNLMKYKRNEHKEFNEIQEDKIREMNRNGYSLKKTSGNRYHRSLGNPVTKK